MNWVNVKKSSEVNIPGISVEVDKTESTLNCVTITDAEGNKVRVRMTSYTMYLEVPAKPTMVKKFAVRGTYRGLEVDELYDASFLAGERAMELDNEIEVTEVEVSEVSE